MANIQLLARIMQDIRKAINSYQSTVAIVVKTIQWTEQHFQRCFFFIGMVVLSPSPVLDLPVSKFKTMHYQFPSHFLTTCDNNIG